MKLEFCAVCGCKEDLHHHHFTPKSMGGLDDEINLITLCYKHHKEIHGNLSEYSRKVNHSQLTKMGLQKAKQRGVKLGGTPDGARKAREQAKVVRQQQADERAENLREILTPISNKSLREIADQLETLNIKTAQGKTKWTPTQISRVLNRLGLT